MPQYCPFLSYASSHVHWKMHWQRHAAVSSACAEAAGPAPEAAAGLADAAHATEAAAANPAFGGGVATAVQVLSNCENLPRKAYPCQEHLQSPESPCKRLSWQKRSLGSATQPTLLTQLPFGYRAWRRCGCMWRPRGSMGLALAPSCFQTTALASCRRYSCWRSPEASHFSAQPACSAIDIPRSQQATSSHRTAVASVHRSSQACICTVERSRPVGRMVREDVERMRRMSPAGLLSSGGGGRGAVRVAALRGGHPAAPGFRCAVLAATRQHKSI